MTYQSKLLSGHSSIAKMPILSLVAVTLVLSACGGGGGDARPQPIAAPPPAPPPPPPITTSIGAPAAASAAAGAVFPQSSINGPTLTAPGPGTTAFPLVQSAVTVTPTTVAADLATTNAGATLSLNGSTGALTFDIANPALRISNVPLNREGNSSIYSAVLADGRKIEVIYFTQAGAQTLSHTFLGAWALSSSSVTNAGSFIGGYETPGASVPTSGTANYAGTTYGSVFFPDNSGSGVTSLQISGTANLQANFAMGSLTGSLTDVVATDFETIKMPWNSVSLSATFSGGQSRFSGTSAATSAPGNSASLSGSAIGTVEGRFFGPGAGELGAVWTLSDGSKSAIGTIGAKKGN